jgi:hypothetical protein
MWLDAASRAGPPGNLRKRPVIFRSCPFRDIERTMLGATRTACVAWLAGALAWAATGAAQTPAATEPASAPPTADTQPSAPAAGDPAPEVQAQYRDVVANAVIEFDAGRWAEARALFVRAHELWPSARTYRTLGMTSFELRAYAQALSELQAALEDPRRPLPADQRAQVAALAEQARAFVGRYRVRVSPPESQLLVDGAPHALGEDGVLLLEVGRHELRARAAGHAELARRLDVRGREDEELVLELASLQPEALPPVAAPLPKAAETRAGEPRSGDRLFTWIAAGTAVALAGTSLALWLIADSKFDEQQEECDAMLPAMACERGTIETAGIQDLDTAHQVTAVAAGVVGAAAVALFFIEGRPEEPPALTIGPGSVLARARF